MFELGLQPGRGLDPVAAWVQLGHMLEAESEPGAVVVSLTAALIAALTASSRGHGAVEEPASAAELDSLWFG